MLLAKSMLTKGAPLREISMTLGYYDVHHFSRSFKKSEGVSPAQFARQAGSDRPMLGPRPAV